MHVEVLLEQVRLVAFFALGRVSALSYLPFLQHFQPHILRVCLFYTAKFPADCTIHLMRTSFFHLVFVSTSSPRHDEHSLDFGQSLGL